ncbi:MAG: VCBS repeat-containing protein [Planctomycetales bacterium]
MDPFWDGSTARSQKISTWNAATVYSNLMVGDVTGDGRVDLVERDMFGNFWALNYNGSTYLTTFLRGWNTNVAWKNFALVDLNGDGVQEVVGCDSTTLNWWGIFKKGNGYVSQLVINGTQNISANAVTVADLDGDGNQELIGFNTTAKQYWALSFVNDTATVQTLASGVNWQRLQVGNIPGTTDGMLRRQILQEVPDLKGALANGSTLQAATLILQWAAVAGDFALNGNVLAPLVNTVSEQYYNIFRQNLAGMSCGGYAAFYSGVLQLFGIDSLNVGVGNLPLISHTTVLIPIQEAGVWKFYLLDPTFGAMFVNLDTGKTATFFDLVDDQIAGKLNRISTTQFSLDGRDFVSPTAVSSGSVVLKGQNSANYIYSWPGYGLSSYIQTYVNEMQASGFQTGLTGFVQLLMNHVYLVQAYGATSVPAASVFLSELSKRGIVYGS